MKLHPHDSICGCSCDDVHLRMKYSFSAIAEMSSVLERRGMNALVVHSSFHKKNNGMFTIALFNSTERTMEDVVCVELDFPKRDNIKSFDIQDEEGNHIFYEITKKIHTSTSVYSDNNLPITMDIDRLTVCFNSGKIKPYSSKYFSVITNKNIKVFS